MDSQILQLAESLGEKLQRLGWKVTAAESCTGGAIAAAITSAAGASAWFEGSVVSYADRIKRDFLGVDRKDLEEFGAVSEAVVRQMAVGVLNRLDANLAVAVSGIAGPDGGSEEKPVGTVWIGWAHGEGQEPVQADARLLHFEGNRAQIQSQTVIEALRGMLEIAELHCKR
ncbi:CinA family protein [Microbulbifer hydrolyticus]|uniref:Nicotinamide-nucleotide amidase n=1 Tax=Microbulbifer hydrolyticus TaxID=48074 RepID=A0A6P1TAC4_9GAMM|nr:CinA family protein [Microbulbifer hydrolyticus]MBB5213192.1 nicotinamide-nucleotide amidase [Microbulbifer hydrolyticus]QHQ38540.1 nicotinamide-nucleotide amidohydrolase family protein [Microbulbifer hydrolyticus]